MELNHFFPYINSDENQTVFDKMIDRVKISSALCAATLGKWEIFCVCVMSSLVLPYLVFYSAMIYMRLPCLMQIANKTGYDLPFFSPIS